MVFVAVFVERASLTPLGSPRDAQRHASLNAALSYTLNFVRRVCLPSADIGFPSGKTESGGGGVIQGLEEYAVGFGSLAAMPSTPLPRLSF